VWRPDCYRRRYVGLQSAGSIDTNHVLSAYAYYHFSGIKKTVDAAKRFRVYFDKSGLSLADGNKASTNVALAYLRKAAKSYMAVVPGAALYVDSAFDSLDEIFEAHEVEASIITQRAFNEIQAITRKGGDSLQTAGEVAAVLKKYLIDLHGLGTKAGGDVVNAMGQKYPGAKEKLDGAFDELKRLADQGGPAAQRVFNDAQLQVNIHTSVL
jgi:hypothetical protein